MSTAGAGHATGNQGGGVDWDSVLNLTMKDIRTKVYLITSISVLIQVF